MLATGDVFKMLVFYPVLVRQYAQYGNVLCMWVFFRSQCVSTLSTAMFFICVYFFGLSTLVRLVRQCSMYVGIFSVLVRQCAQYGHVLCMLVFFSVLVCQYAQRGNVLMYVAIFFGVSTFVRLVRPCSMYVAIFFGLSTLVRLVQPCSHVCWYFIRSQYVSTLSTAMFYACWYFIWSQYVQYGHVLSILVFHSVLVRLVQPIVPFSSACMHGFLQLCHRAQHVTKTADITLSD